jgi:3'-phosphoadenosine 5'-phosphosulfate sulfotransferase
MTVVMKLSVEYVIDTLVLKPYTKEMKNYLVRLQANPEVDVILVYDEFTDPNYQDLFAQEVSFMEFIHTGR